MSIQSNSPPIARSRQGSMNSTSVNSHEDSKQSAVTAADLYSPQTPMITTTMVTISPAASVPSPSQSPPPSTSTDAPLLPLSLGPALWLLFLCTMVYMIGQLNRWSLGVVAKPLELSLHFGDGTGSGFEFQLLAGPAFSAIFSVTGVALTGVARSVHRGRMLACNLLLACMACVITSFAESYAILALSRVLMGLSQAGTNSFCASLIASGFNTAHRGKAMGLFNLGVYGGYGGAFGLASLLDAQSGSAHPEAWRTLFRVMAVPCFVVSILFATSVTDREYAARKQKQIQLRETTQRDTLSAPLLSPGQQLEDSLNNSNDLSSPTASPSRPPVPEHTSASLWECLSFLLHSPALLCLCFASAIRTGAGTAWGYNAEQFYENVVGLSPNHISSYMSWVPLVAGSTGAFVGGIIADFLLKRYGENARYFFLVICQFVSAPAAYMVLNLSSPYTFLMYGLYLLVAESYIGVCYAILMDLSPARFHSVLVAFYVLFMANIGGNFNVLLPFLHKAMGGQVTSNGAENSTYALEVLWAGGVALSGILYAIMWSRVNKAKQDKLLQQHSAA